MCRSVHLAVCLNFNLHPGLAPLHLWQCTHFGAPLATGSFYKDQIACPWHCASFCVKTGDIEDAPALVSLPGFAGDVGTVFFRAPAPSGCGVDDGTTRASKCSDALSFTVLLAPSAPVCRGGSGVSLAYRRPCRVSVLSSP